MSQKHDQGAAAILQRLPAHELADGLAGEIQILLREASPKTRQELADTIMSTCLRTVREGASQLIRPLLQKRIDEAVSRAMDALDQDIEAQVQVEVAKRWRAAVEARAEALLNQALQSVKREFTR